MPNLLKVLGGVNLCYRIQMTNNSYDLTEAKSCLGINLNTAEITYLNHLLIGA